MFICVVLFRVSDVCWGEIGGDGSSSIESVCSDPASTTYSILRMAAACEVEVDDDTDGSEACDTLYDIRESACTERVAKACSMGVCVALYPELADLIPKPTKTPKQPKPTTNSSVVNVSSVVEHISLSGTLLQAFYATVVVDALLLLIFVCTLCGCCGARMPSNIE